ncbi:MAG: NUDIX domain-containing protein [Candidatus Levybacteria bacterium]|nr:NUDIX domain-containing protein [Candidatus Levybacteria bacterium]
MANSKTVFIILISGILYNKEGNILLVKRSKQHKAFKESWQLPEGKMEKGEQPDQTILREIKEELNLDVLNSKFVFANSTLITLKNKTYHLLRIVLKTKWKGVISLSEEHDAYKWIGVKEAVKMSHLVDGTTEVLRNIEQSKKREL